MLSTFDPREEYLGNGLLDTYTFDFKITSLSHLRVIKLNSSGTVVFDVRGTDSTYIDSVTYDATDGGGQVVLVDAVETDYNLIILQANDEPLQEFEFKNKGDFTLSRFEQVLDIIVGAIQRLAYSSKRSLRAPEGTLDAVAFDGELDTLTAEALVRVNDDGDGFTMGPTLTDFNADVAAAAASAAAAAVSETAAAASASAASTSATAAATAETNAETAETNAEAAEALAEQWATKTDGIVDATDYSSKAWAIGGTGVTDTASKGAAKEWAIETASTVDTSEYSAKEYAVGTQRRGAANGGSAKDWATYTGGTVDNSEYSAKYYAQQAAVSAGQPTYSEITAAGAYAPDTSASRFILFDATLGNQSLTLPAIDPSNNGLTFTIKKKDSSSNTVTITGTVEGEVNPVTDQQYTTRTVVAFEGAWYWKLDDEMAAAYSVMRVPSGGGKPRLGSIDLSQAAAVTGVLPVARGGTNSGTALNNNRVMQSSGGAVVEAAAITAARALISDANGIPTHATTTATELDYVNGVTSAIQTQLDAKAPLASPTFTGVATFESIDGTIETDNATTGADQTIGATKFIKRMTDASLASVCGVTAPVGPRLIILVNATGADVTVKNDTTATAADRIITGTGANLSWANTSSLWLFYDVTSARWRIVGGSGAGGSTAVYGSTGSPRSVVAADGIIAASSHMSTTDRDQMVFITSSVASAITAVSANPQIQAHTVVGATMEIYGTSDSDVVELVDGNGLSLNGNWQGTSGAVLGLRWNGTVWRERYRS